MAQLEREQDALQRASHKYQHYELNKASAFDSSCDLSYFSFRGGKWAWHWSFPSYICVFACYLLLQTCLIQVVHIYHLVEMLRQIRFELYHRGVHGLDYALVIFTERRVVSFHFEEVARFRQLFFSHNVWDVTDHCVIVLLHICFGYNQLDHDVFPLCSLTSSNMCWALTCDVRRNSTFNAGCKWWGM